MAGLDSGLPIVLMFLPRGFLPPCDAELWAQRMENLVKAGLTNILLAGIRAGLDDDDSTAANLSVCAVLPMFAHRPPIGSQYFIRKYAIVDSDRSFSLT